MATKSNIADCSMGERTISRRGSLNVRGSGEKAAEDRCAVLLRKRKEPNQCFYSPDSVNHSRYSGNQSIVCLCVRMFVRPYTSIHMPARKCVCFCEHICSNLCYCIYVMYISNIHSVYAWASTCEKTCVCICSKYAVYMRRKERERQ